MRSKYGPAEAEHRVVKTTNPFLSIQESDLEDDIPIVQGGMRVGICLSSSASTVANAGDIGIIATAGCRHERFKVQFKG